MKLTFYPNTNNVVVSYGDNYVEYVPLGLIELVIKEKLPLKYIKYLSYVSLDN